MMKTEKIDETLPAAAGNLKAVHRTKLYEQIVGQIQRLIDEGKLKYGDQLPTERKLAEIFQVSRHSVREAIRILEQKNVVRSRIGSGTYVISEDEPSVVEFLAKAIQKEKDKVLEIFQFRYMIEPELAHLAAQNATDEQIENLKNLVTQHKQAFNDVERSVALDHAFHMVLAQAAGNSVILGIVERINDILSETRAEYSQSPARSKASYQGHKAVYEAIKNRDPDQARIAMSNHLRQVEALVVNHPDS